MAYARRLDTRITEVGISVEYCFEWCSTKFVDSAEKCCTAYIHQDIIEVECCCKDFAKTV
jgi:hypothetical protein